MFAKNFFLLLFFFASFQVVASGDAMKDWSDFKKLMKLLKSQNTGQAECYIRSGINLNVLGPSGFAPMHLAAQNGNVSLAKLLLQNKADLNTLDQEGRTPLYLAAYEGNKDFVKWAIRNGAHVDKAFKEETALHVAARKGHPFIVKDLITFGHADVNLPLVSNKKTALHLASAKGKLEVVKVLVDAGAHINARDKNNATPLFLASRFNKVEVVEYLISNRADDTAKAKIKINNKEEQMTPLEIAKRMEYAKVVNTISSLTELRTVQTDLLLQATFEGDFLNCQRILKNLKNFGILSQCLEIAITNNYVQIASLLMDHGADPNVFFTNSYKSALYFAAELNHTEMVRTLIERGAWVDFAGNAEKRRAALHVAAKMNHLEVAKALKEGGADLNVRDSRLLTAKRLAYRHPLDKNRKELRKFFSTWSDEVKGKNVGKPLITKGSERLTRNNAKAKILTSSEASESSRTSKLSQTTEI